MLGFALLRPSSRRVLNGHIRSLRALTSLGGTSLFDAVIVGSGPAGVAAAYELWGRHICMVDVGKSPPDTNWGSGSNFYQLSRDPDRYWNEFVGPRFDSLRNIDKAYV